ncbi:hypothetical protein DWB68_10285 [Galactobacter valiniphilus]|uniref:Uncharacterized protein n=1 Tax=Galactobacter valiniphilus TaxID=2676122 RepID=A0A399J8M0_9MICC|nr:hypothetical protein [Galactobacter valiniphilus]RII41905.1 hypothetical protein DWB68_10285 [Galactobacter valiniphilus]
MSTLPGNPHLEMAQANIDAEELLPEGAESTGLRELAQIEATLAVAHELRTTNLIAWLNFQHAWDRDGGYFDDQESNLFPQIATRLGLGGEGQ